MEACLFVKMNVFNYELKITLHEMWRGTRQERHAGASNENKFKFCEI